MCDLKFNCKWCNKEVITDDYSEVYEKGFCCYNCLHNHIQTEIIASGLRNEGVSIERTKHKHGDLEKALSVRWRKENEPRPGINYGQGILQDLFMERRQFSTQMGLEIKAEHRFVAATVVQWLGSNIGLCFLGEALGECGYKITKKE